MSNNLQFCFTTLQHGLTHVLNLKSKSRIKGVKTVAELICEHSTTVKSGQTTYIPRVYGKRRADGTWEGWLEFHPSDNSGPVLCTPGETSQPSRTTIVYWAFGLEPVYLEGALARAQSRLPGRKGTRASVPYRTSQSVEQLFR